MINNKAIGYITANYTALKQETLLQSRPIASVPVMGRYRLIDFPLSNMANAGIKTVGLVMPGNYRSIIDAHEASGVGITMVYVKAERDHEDACSLVIGDAGRVIEVREGCKYGDNKFVDCFIINRDLLLQIIDRYASADYLDIFEAIAADFSRIDVCSYEFKGLAVGMFNEETYYQRSMEMLDPVINKQLFRKDRPILTKAHDAAPAKYSSGSVACNSRISAGCEIMGTVRNSILSRGVVVESGANVVNSIIMQGVIIKSGARVENAIIDKNNVVPANTELRGTPDAILSVGKAPTV